MDEILKRLRDVCAQTCGESTDEWCETHRTCLECRMDLLDMLEKELDGWAALPRDADGVPCHVGDVMEWPGGDTFEVVGIGDGTLFYLDGDCATEMSADWTGASTKCHHKPDTWERIIEDARTCTGSAGNYTSVPSMRWTSEVDDLVERCERLAGGRA
jgi:hypothetical protein